MARINFEDNVEAQNEFWALMPIVGDRDAALGKLVRFFRLAQKAYGRGETMSRQDLEHHGLTCMIESGWAVADGDGFYCKGEDKYFAWYRQRVASAEAGGRARSAAARDEKGRFEQSSRNPAGIQPGTTRDHPASSLPSPVLKERRIHALPAERANSSFDLEAAYQEYPRKRGKQRGLKLARKAIQSESELELLKKAIRNYASECARLGQGEAHMKYFDTFMGEWRDWIDPPAVLELNGKGRKTQPDLKFTDSTEEVLHA